MNDLKKKYLVLLTTLVGGFEAVLFLSLTMMLLHEHSIHSLYHWISPLFLGISGWMAIKVVGGFLQWSGPIFGRAAFYSFLLASIANLAGAVLLGIGMYTFIFHNPYNAHAAEIACTLEYNPVCGSKEVQCVRAPCYPVYQTYSNNCFLNADGATFVYKGECLEEGMGTACTKEYVPVCGQKTQCPSCTSSNPPCMAPCSLTEKTYSNACMLRADDAFLAHTGECTDEGSSGGTNTGENYTPPEGCTAWFDGCNRCSKGPGDSAMCTLMACMGEPVPGYCTSYDTVEPSVATDPPSSGDGAPPIPTAPPGENPDSEPRGFLARMWFIVTSWFLSLF
jgi:hypothetical protein